MNLPSLLSYQQEKSNDTSIPRHFRDPVRPRRRTASRSPAKALSRSDLIGHEERFWASVRKSDGCWEWIGARNDLAEGTVGYGTFHISGRRTTVAHRVSSVLDEGDIARGVLVLHECDHKPCVRPSHLHRGDDLQNSKEAVERGRIGGPREEWASSSCGSGDEWTGGSGVCLVGCYGTCSECDGIGFAPYVCDETERTAAVFHYLLTADQQVVSGPCPSCGGTGFGSASLRFAGPHASVEMLP